MIENTDLIQSLLKDIRNFLVAGISIDIADELSKEYKPIASTVSISLVQDTKKIIYTSKKLSLQKSLLDILTRIQNDARLSQFDIEDVNKCLIEFKMYKTSDMITTNLTNLYRVRFFQKDFLLYLDNSQDTKEQYEVFFHSIKTLVPLNGGRKILLTSEVKDMQVNKFHENIVDAEIEHIFSVGRYDGLCYKYAESFEQIKHFLLEFIGSDDILCVKGMSKYRLEEILKFIKSFEYSSVSLKKDNFDLSYIGRRIDIKDIVEYKEKLKISKNISWAYYFPFLILFAKSIFRDLLIEEIEGKIVIYMIRENNNENLEVYFPPFPMEEEALSKMQIKMRKIHNDAISILWIDENDRKTFVKDFILYKREDEYLYNYKKIEKLEGKTLKNLRYNLRKFKNENNFELRDYNIKDYFECIDILQKWKEIQNDKYEVFYDNEYTKNCLRFAHKFDEKDLFGKVVLINGSIKAFGFAGEMHSEVANIFIVKALPTITGLAYFLKFELLKLLKDYELVNDSSGLGNKGLEKAKKSFHPVRMHKVYSAREKN